MSYGSARRVWVCSLFVCVSVCAHRPNPYSHRTGPRRIRNCIHSYQAPNFREHTRTMRTFAVLWLASLSCTALTVIEHTMHQQHRPPPRMPHAEVPARLEAAKAALLGSAFAHKLSWRSTAELEQDLGVVEAALQRVHSAELIESIKQLSTRGGGVDSDTYVAPGSWEAILDGTSSWLEATTLAAKGAGPALALARPPGHHATRNVAMGFCLANFAAAAAADFLARHPSRTIAILDWDVHHGNGVADILANEPRARYYRCRHLYRVRTTQTRSLTLTPM